MPKTKLMGILNATPDSFYSNSRSETFEKAIDRAFEMEKEGADIIDIGGESTRPGSFSVTVDEEINRVIPLISYLSDKLSIPISIDTKKPAVARAALSSGAKLLNDVSGFSNPEMVRIAKEFGVDICVMHMQGCPLTMQQNPAYKEGIIPHLLTWFKERTNSLISEGVNKSSIIIDPGIGFGKTVADNLEILHNLPLFSELGFRVLLGISRKSFLAKILNQPTDKLLPATIGFNSLAIAAGVDIIRVHDIQEHRLVIDALTYESS